MKIRKAVFPVAGLGTRFLPATKSMPKEMLPLIDKPLIQYVVEEAVAAGIEQIIFVTGRTKRAIEDYFDKDYRLETQLRDSGKTELLKMVNAITDMVEVCYVRQKEALGLGHAVLTAKRLVGDEPFAVLLGDDIIEAPRSCIGQLIEKYEKYRCTILGIEQVPMEQISSYGCVAGTLVEPRTYKVSDLVEKPPVNEAPSDMAIIGRYVLTPEIFEIIEKTKPGRGGEIQLTDALRELERRQAIYACQFEGKRYDCGDKLEYLKATVEMALKHPQFGKPFGEFIASLPK
ncbi:UTP--glucose-1-phosphate uridylyltransferase GalU [Chrysiogenes arsenatis]|uniref:UTP--glucose-1-phosphate uridylyltransferase GalU n=1 Tax=Chrysiogenes arsenatis TaxID=309797 RepID=UPI0004049E00|nr:UTP--glucose-1-phosphate uridylyltransferase GalU [Chrysiogenes arsenatis]